MLKLADGAGAHGVQRGGEVIISSDLSDLRLAQALGAVGANIIAPTCVGGTSILHDTERAKAEQMVYLGAYSAQSGGEV